MNDVYTYIAPLPPGVNEVITPCYGGYTVYLNDSLSEDGRIDAFNHAMCHIRNNDFEKSDVHEIETRAHEETA